MRIYFSSITASLLLLIHRLTMEMENENGGIRNKVPRTTTYFQRLTSCTQEYVMPSRRSSSPRGYLDTLLEGLGGVARQHCLFDHSVII